jgi:hypothetical protein
MKDPVEGEADDDEDDGRKIEPGEGDDRDCSDAPSEGQAEPTTRPRMSPASIWSGSDTTDLLTGASMLATAFLLLRLSF